MKKHTLSYLLSLYLGTIGTAVADNSSLNATATINEQTDNLNIDTAAIQAETAIIKAQPEALTSDITTPTNENTIAQDQPENFGMDAIELKDAMMTKIQELDLDMFSLLDVDNNQKLSRTECENSLNGFDSISVFSPVDSQEIRDSFIKAFDLFDKDKDSYLNKAESEEYFAHIYGLMSDAQINKMDLDKDGKVSLQEMTAYQKNLPSPEESLKKLQEATAKLKAITENPEQFAEQLITKVGEASNVEEANQMDSDNDGKITSDEYVNYMFNHPNNQELKFSKEDYTEIFKQIDDSQRGYITEQEYIEYNQKQMKDVMEEAKQEVAEHPEINEETADNPTISSEKAPATPPEEITNTK